MCNYVHSVHSSLYVDVEIKIITQAQKFQNAGHNLNVNLLSNSQFINFTL